MTTTDADTRAAPSAGRATLDTVRYDARRWGIGELVFMRDAPVAHDLPSTRRAPGPGPVRPAQAALVERVQAYFAGDRVSFADVDLEPTIELWGLTPFEARVTRALQLVPWGETISYGGLAAAAGSFGAARAAGSVCARGQLSLILPYHRVIAADGSIGSYGLTGVRQKRRLLAHEGVRPT